MKVILRSVSSVALAAYISGCRSPEQWRKQADKKAETNLEITQQRIIGRTEPISVETPGDTLRRRLLLDQKLTVNDPASLGIRDVPDSDTWKADKYLLPPNDADGAMGLNTTNSVKVGILDVVRIAAANSRDYQNEKDSLFSTALALDLEANAFRSTFSGMFTSNLRSSRGEDAEKRDTGLDNKFKLGATKVFENGTQVASSIAVDLAGMLSGDKDSAWGVLADASVTIPLLRGSGRFVTMEPLTQAQRNLVYKVREFEQYKRSFVVRVTSAYLNVLLSKQRMQNEEENYKRIITSTRRSRRMADAGRLKEYEFDQSYQGELSARNSWISAQQSYDSTLDSFKILLGLPPDARLEPDDADLAKLQEYTETFAKFNITAYDMGDDYDSDDIVLVVPDNSHAGPMEIDEDLALEIAFANRPDLQTSRDKVEDAQRHVRIAEDALRAEVTIGGSASVGESVSSGGAADGDGHFRVSRGTYSGLLKIDLPFERTRERNSYRNSLITLEQTVRSYQNAEDALKQSIRSSVRDMTERREQLKIQFVAVSLAERRVANTDLLLRAGRAEMRDVLEAQQALLSAQNSLYSAITGYRIDELELQKELGVLSVTSTGEWEMITDLKAESEPPAQLTSNNKHLTTHN